MLKKLMGLICLLVVFGSYAQDTERLIEYSYEFQPNLTESFSNPFFWSVKINCHAQLSDDIITFRAHVTHQGGTVDGQHVDEGQVIYFSVYDGQSVRVTAEGWASLEVTNVSSMPVTITCKV